MALAEYTVGRAVLVLAEPGDDEVSRRVGGHRGVALEAGRIAVDPELRPDRSAGTGITLAEDAVARTVRIAVPDDHEAPGSVRRHRRSVLAVQGEGVDAELRSQGSAGAGIALRDHAVAGAVEGMDPVPGHDEVARRVRGDIGSGLQAVREAVDPELGAEGRPRARKALAEDAEVGA